MKDPKEHIDIDLEFLDKKEPIRVAPKPETPKGNEPNWRYYDSNKAKDNSGSGNKYNWKNILIVVGVSIFIGGAVFSSSESPSTSSSTYSSNANDDVRVGQYRCSSSNARRADELETDVPEATIKAESDALDRRITALKAWGNRIDATYVDEYDQDSIDAYNSQVNSYNSTKNKLNFDISIYEAKLPRYNSQVGIYNSFLENNCTKAY